MTFEEYFGDWSKIINKEETARILKWLSTQDSSFICPAKQNIFKAFKLCPLNKCLTIWVGQDPYPQLGIAQGLLFGNPSNTSKENYSPSLSVIEEAIVDYTIPHNIVNFDCTMEFIAKQGVLLINSAFTCQVNQIGSHFNIWKDFTAKLLENLSNYSDNYYWILFGKQAQSFRSFIKGNQVIKEVYHPAYYARNNESMPSTVFTDMNLYLKNHFNEKVLLYEES